MRKIPVCVAMAALALSFAVPSMAQTMAQAGSAPAVEMADHSLRASKLIGSPVYNEQDEKIGTIEDILVMTSGGEPTAVLSVGGYINGGNKMVAVPLSHVKLGPKMTMAGASKGALSAMPVYLFKPADSHG